MRVLDEQSNDDAFAVLGVPRDCTRGELKHAYRQLVRIHHPDVSANADAGLQMRRINAAFEVATRILDQRDAAAICPSEPPPGPSRRGSGAPALAKHLQVGAALVMRHSRWARIGLAGLVSAALSLAIGLLLLRAVPFAVAPVAQSLDKVNLQLGGTTALTVSGFGRVYAVEQRLAKLPPGFQVTDNPQWSFDHQFVAVTAVRLGGSHSQTSVFVLRAQSGEVLRTIRGFFARWAPQTDWIGLLTATADSSTPELSLVDMSSNGKQSVLATSAGTRLAWSPSGAKLVFSVQGQRGLRILDVATGTLSPEMVAPARMHIIPLIWLSATEVLCAQQSIGGTATLTLLNVMDGSQLPLASSISTSISPARSPAGDAVLYASGASVRDEVVAHLLLWRSHEDVDLRHLASPAFMAGWSTDAHWVAMSSARGAAPPSTICLLWLPTPPRAAPSPSRPACAGAPGRIEGISWEPAGDRLSYVLAGIGDDSLEVREIVLVTSPASPQGDVPGGRPITPLVAALGLPLFRRNGAHRRRAESASALSGRQSDDGPDKHGPCPGRPLRMTVVSEALRWPPDEALKRTALSLVNGLSRYGVVTAIAPRGQRPGAEPYPAIPVNASRTFLDYRLWRVLWQSRPHILCYLPGSGITTFSLLRALVLRLGFLVVGARPLFLLLSLQPRSHGWLDHWLMRRLSPSHLLVHSRRTRAIFAAKGYNATVLPAGVDLDVFHPVTQRRRNELRRQYGVPRDRFVVLHVGHLKANRNLDYLAALRRRFPMIEVVVVVSTSTVAEPGRAAALRKAGICVIDGYLRHVEEAYQLADCYVFPVRDADGSAEMPLSVIEALACGLPVITTAFGAISEWLPSSDCVQYFETMAELAAAVSARMQIGRVHSVARQLVADYNWTAIIDRLVRDALTVTHSQVRACKAETGKQGTGADRVLC